MKKIGVFLILGALCVALLAGCGSNNTPSEVTESNVAISTESETAEASTPESSEESSENPSDAPTITMQLQDYTGNNIGEFPMISGVENDAVDTINQQIKDRMTTYQQHLQNDDGSWIEHRAYPVSTSHYLNIVTTEVSYPNYGTQGVAKSYNYDIDNQTVVSVDDALALANTTREEIEAVCDVYIANTDEYLEVTKVDMDAFVIHEDVSVDFFIRIATDNKADAPTSGVTGASNALYTYNASEKTITPYVVNSELIPGAGLSDAS